MKNKIIFEDNEDNISLFFIVYYPYFPIKISLCIKMVFTYILGQVLSPSME